MAFKVLLSDFSKVLIFPKDSSYTGTLNALFKDAVQGEKKDFWSLYALNQELLDFYQKLIDQHQLVCAIWTSGTLQRSPELAEYLSPVFDHDYSVVDLKVAKSEPQAYKLLATELQVTPEEMIFIDDSLSNVEAAGEAGVSAIQFQNTNQAKVDLEKLLS